MDQLINSFFNQITFSVLFLLSLLTFKIMFDHLSYLK
jgi:hypothetical protein